MIRLELESGEYVDVDKNVVKHFKTLESMIQDNLNLEGEEETKKSIDEDGDVDSTSSSILMTIPIIGFNVSLKILKEAISYYWILLSEPEDDEWKHDFFGKTNSELVELILFSDFIHAEELTTDTAKAIAKTLENKTPEKIREEWNLPDDLSEKEKEEIREQNKRILDL
jgi:hypothetical protein